MPTLNGASGVREKIKWEYGKPETVLLKFAQGKEIQGNYGVEFMFSTVDDRIFFLPHEQAGDLERLAQDIGQRPIVITKFRGTGKGNPVYWQIKAAQEARAIALRNGNGNGHHEPEPEPESEMERKLRESIAFEQAKKAAQAQAIPMPGSIPQALGQMYAECLIAAIDAMMLGQAYARQKGREDFRFNEDEITRAAIHLSIGAQDRSSR